MENPFSSRGTNGLHVGAHKNLVAFFSNLGYLDTHLHDQQVILNSLDFTD